MTCTRSPSSLGREGLELSDIDVLTRTVDGSPPQEACLGESKLVDGLGRDWGEPKVRRERSSHKCRSCREKSVDDQVDLEGLEARGQLLWSDGPCSWVPGRILCVRKRHRNDWGVCKCWGQYEDAGAYTLTRIGGNRADLTEPTRWSTLTHAFRALSGPDHRTPGGRSCSTLMIRGFFASGHRVQARQCAPLKGATGADRINTEFSAWHSLVRGLGFDTFCARVNGRRSAGRSPNGTSRFRERVCGCRTGVGSRSERS